MRLPFRLAATVLCSLCFCGVAAADVINFEPPQAALGPSTFPGSAQTLNITTAPSGTTTTLTGGALLSSTANLPADQTNLYGTIGPGLGSGTSGYTDPMVLNFNKSITNFVATVYNGNLTAENFLVSDNVGNSAMFNLPPNLSGGNSMVFFPAAGTQVTITEQGVGTSWDFFVDNVMFDVPLPGATPEPASFVLVGLAGATLCSWRWCKQRSLRRKQASAI